MRRVSAVVGPSTSPANDGHVQKRFPYWHRPSTGLGLWVGGGTGLWWCCCIPVSLLPLLGQQQSGSGHGEGRELACDKRRLLCLFGE